MDIDDLFGAFNGEEKAREIDQARDEQGQAGGKRKTAGECKKGGTVEAGNKRQQTLPTTGNVTPTSKEQTEHVRRNGDVSRNGGGKAKVEGRTALIEGQESSIVREDGTLLKSVRGSQILHVGSSLGPIIGLAIRLVLGCLREAPDHTCKTERASANRS